MGIFREREKGVEAGHKLNSKASDRFDSSDCLLQAIESVLASKAHVRISTDHGQVWIDPRRRVFWQAINDRTAFFQTPSRSARLSHRDFDCNGTPRPVEELLWEAAYRGSSGTLLNRHDPLTTVRLRRWPNLARIPHTPAMIRLCALIHQRAASMSVAIRLLHVAEPEAWRFFNAALASGLAREIRGGEDDGPPEAPVLTGATRRVSAFWSQLFQRLGGA